ncbi:ammonia-dependent NAD(+) synthetase [Ligilactobacillus equi]|uniref:NH(3)-dependent NAD(+) synthetase n=1 Tax=Ligilactobacillus equi DPC 6820 TaxID=1392007 RepID=V7HY22_9LACO|nr:ammonia-dependent NAD(+) synthetase [Ligilactobacillus equi]ETA73906.1 NAD synthetase [Ligilactobacillus equi DPC 6820]
MRALQKQIISDLRVKPVIDPQTEIRTSVDFLKAYLLAHPFLKTLVLGISGGQDSTLAGKLCQIAMEELRQETGDASYQFIAVRLPYGTQADESDAMDAIAFMGADVTMRVNIKEAADAMMAAVEENGLEVSDFNKGNIKARQRMIAQYAIAGAKNGAVVGTDHAAEAITGFYTKFGDGGADVTPLWRLNKRQGRAMLEVLGAPKHLYEKAPTADLEEDRPALPDEVALGVTYTQIDDYLEGKYIDPAAAEKIEGWYTKTAHKRHLPITVYDDFWKK